MSLQVSAPAPAARGCGDGVRRFAAPPGLWLCRCWNNEGVLAQMVPHLQVVRSWGTTGIPVDLGVSRDFFFQSSSSPKKKCFLIRLFPDHVYPSGGFSFKEMNIVKPVHAYDKSLSPSTFQ